MQTQLITARRLGWLCGALYCTQLQAATVSCTNLESWLASKAYNGGSTVQHEQKAYKANWWNQNKNPAQYANPYQEWTKQGDCDGVVVNQPPQVTMTAPAAGSSHSAGTAVTLSANASDADGSVSKVEFYVDNQLAGSDNTRIIQAASSTVRVIGPAARPV